ncbi:MFS transporter, partial [Ornithobacterium rhinotracheale]
LILFMMQQIAPGKYQMTHYAFANSIMNLSVLVPGYVSGLLSEKPTQIIILDKLNLTNWVPQEFLGYELFFMLVMVFTIPALLMTWFVPFTYDDEKK